MASKWNNIDATYDYVDENGTLAYQVCRWNEPKSFGQRRPDGKGGWVYSLNGERRIPFMLPELLNAVRRGDDIYVPEGEKDVLNLQALGVCATTNAQGAKWKWTDDWADFFKGAKRVIVLADNDTVGHEHAEQVAGIIARVAEDVRILTLPGDEKSDVSDWLANGGTLEQLEALAAVAPKAKASKPRVKVDVVKPIALNTMDQWRALANEIADDGKVDVLTPAEERRASGFRSMRCPFPGHSHEAAKPSAWLGDDGKNYVWACDQHGTHLLLPFLVESKWATDKADARAKLSELGYTLPAKPSKGYVPAMDAATAKLAVTELIAKRSDIANGRWFVKLFANSVRYNRDRQSWYVWDGKRWLMDTGTDIEKYAKRAVDELLRQAIKLSLDDEKRQALIKYASQCGTVKAVTNMLKMAPSEDEIECREADFDANPHLLTVRNGTIDLRTSELREHRQEDFITRLVDVNYDPSVRSELWEDTLLQVFCDDEDTVRYFQRAMGYSVTGDVSEECFFMMYGHGRNGKGTTLETVQALLPEYRKTTPFDTFLKQDKRGSATPELAELAGARIVIASEAPEDGRFALDRLKGVTGGDEVTARFLHCNPFTYKPQFKIWLAVNHRPRASADDQAFWRRVKAVPFNRTFSEAEADKTLKKRLRDELQGVLTWVVEGAVAWYQDGLGTCKAVEESTQEYLAENDHFTRWLSECCIHGEGKIATTKALMDSYTQWVQDNDIAKFEWLNPTAFGNKLGNMGYAKDATKKKRLGIGLLASSNDAARGPAF
jgi:putative DNA primase/helicase